MFIIFHAALMENSGMREVTVEAMKTRLKTYIIIGTLLGCGLLTTKGYANSFIYNNQQRVVNVGMLVCAAENIANKNPAFPGSYPENPDPNFFYVLDSRTDLKPAGMILQNPLAPSVITPAIYQRWDARQNGSDPAFIPGTPQYQIFKVGAQVTKNMGAYWEVNLDNITVADMRQFDLLYIHTHMHNISFTADELDKLIKYVEGGGTLWIEDCGGLSFNPNSPFLFDVQMNNGGGNGQGAIGDPLSPLLTTPYVLTPQEIQTIGDKGVHGYYLYQNPIGSTTDSPPGVVPGTDELTPIVWNTLGQAAPGNGNPGSDWRPYILAGQMGDGRIVFSVQDSGCAINDYVGGVNAGYGGNSGAVSGTNFAAAHVPDLKFVYNLLSWASSHTTAHADVRRTGYSPENVGASLTEKWRYAAPGPVPVSAPAVFNHCIFNVDSNLVLHCFKIDPGTDLDGDGTPDDGIPDYAYGTSYDEIWNLNLKSIDPNATRASTPTVISFYDPSFGNNPPTASGHANFFIRQLVIVVLNTGTVVAARAFPRDNIPPVYPLSATPEVDWVSPQNFGTNYNLPSNMPVPSVAWSEGVLFLGVNTANGGRVVAIDPRNGESAFEPGPNGNIGQHDWQDASVPITPGNPSIWSSPTVGYVQDTASGANDKVVYVTVPAYTGTDGTKYAASVRAFWFSTKGDVLVQSGTQNNDYIFQSSRTTTNVPWYIYDPNNPGNGNPLLRPQVFLVHHNAAGQVDGEEELHYVSGAPAADQFTVVVNKVVIGPTVDSFNTNDPNCTFYANYTLDWSNAALNSGVQRRIMFAPDVNSAGNFISGTPSLTPDDILLYGVNTTPSESTNPGRGVLFAENEQETRPILKWAYVMQDGYSIQVNNQTVQVPPTLVQNDPTQPGAGLPITDVQFIGSPAWYNNTAYAVATAQIAGNPVSVLCAFNADPNIVLRLGQPINPNQTVRIWQFNPELMTNSTTAARVDLQPSQYTIDYASGNITITSMAIPGTVNNFVSASLPFVVQVGSGTETEVPATPGSVNNLLWYMVFPATLNPPANALSPKVSNPALGLVTSSPSIQGNILWLGFAGGEAIGVDANPTLTDPTIQGKGGQVPLFTTTTVQGHMDIVMDLEWNVPGDAGPLLSAPIGTENVMIANTEGGIREYTNTFTLIADKNRLVEVDAAGDAVWTCDGTRNYVVAGGQLPLYIGFDPNGNGNGQPINNLVDTGVAMSSMIPFSSPSVIHSAQNNNYVVVDTGNNRVVDIDSGGNVVWEISSFTDPNNVLGANQPLTLNAPMDCSFWTDAGPNGQTYTEHCLIADTGNYRILELVNTFNANQTGTPPPWVVVWASQTTLNGKKYRYTTAERIWKADPANPNNPPIPLTLACVSNSRIVGLPGIESNSNGDQASSGGGSVVVLDANGNISSTLSNILLPNGKLQPIVAPTCFTSFTVGSGNTLTFHYLLCDANGCYQLVPDANNPNLMDTEWMITANDYYHMTGNHLEATSIRRLSKSVSANGLLHQFLITNHYRGMTDTTVFGPNNIPPAEFDGEVFVLDPTAYNPTAPYDGYVPDYVAVGGTLAPTPNPSIIWRTPGEMIVNNSIRRYIGSQLNGTSTQILEAPMCAVQP